MATNDQNASNDPKQTPDAGASAGTPDTAAAAANTASAGTTGSDKGTDNSPTTGSDSTQDGKGRSSSDKGGRGDRSDRGGRGGRSGGNDRGGKGGRGRRGRRDKPKKEFDEVLLEVRRVTRVTTGGRQLSFRAIILIGNRKGRVGLGVAKGGDVSIAVRKATREAHKNIITVPVTDSQSVPYETVTKYKAARVKLIPAADGTGLKAGSSVRSVLELAGYSNILSKIMGTNNKLNNAIATLHALDGYKSERLKKVHGKKEEATKDEVKKSDETKDTKDASRKTVAKAPAKAKSKKTEDKKED